MTHHSPRHFQTESMSILSNICFVNHHREAETFWVYVMLFVWLGVAVCRCEVKTVGLIPLSTPQGAWALLLFSSWGIKLWLGKYSKTRRRPLCLLPEEQTSLGIFRTDELESYIHYLASTFLFFFLLCFQYEFLIFFALLNKKLMSDIRVFANLTCFP